MQYQLVHALDDRELVKKLLSLPIKETTAKMLEVCRTHNAINREMEALGLGNSKTVHAIHKGPSRMVNERDTNLNNSSRDNNTPVGTAQNSMPRDELPALQRTPNAEHVARQDSGRPSVRWPRGNKQLLDNARLNRTGVPDPDRTGSMKLELMMTPTWMRQGLQQS